MPSIQSAGPVDPALIEDLVAASRILAKHGVLDAWGHVSIRRVIMRMTSVPVEPGVPFYRQRMAGKSFGWVAFSGS